MITDLSKFLSEDVTRKHCQRRIYSLSEDLTTVVIVNTLPSRYRRSSPLNPQSRQCPAIVVHGLQHCNPCYYIRIHCRE